MSRSFGSFGRYIQRRGEIARLGDYLASMGKRPFILIDAFLYDRYVAGLGERVWQCVSGFHRYMSSREWCDGGEQQE